MVRLPYAWKDLWVPVASSSAILIAVAIGVMVLRRQAVNAQLGAGQVLTQWTVSRAAWNRYLRARVSSYAFTVVSWVVLYALVISLFQGQGSFWSRFAGFSGFAAAMIAPPVLVLGTLAWFVPASYAVTVGGVGILSWVVVLLRPGAGFLETSFMPWGRVKEYRWQGDILLFKGDKALFNSGLCELLVVDSHRKAVEEIVRRFKIPKGTGPLFGRPGRGGGKKTKKRRG